MIGASLPLARTGSREIPLNNVDSILPNDGLVLPDFWKWSRRLCTELCFRYIKLWVMFINNNMFAKPKSDERALPFFPGQLLLLHCGFTWTRCLELPVNTCNGSDFRLIITIELHLCVSKFVICDGKRLVGRWTGSAPETVDRENKAIKLKTRGV